MFFLAAGHLLLIGALAFPVQSRFAVLKSFPGLPGYLLSFGLTLFLVNWVNFLLYVLLGWGVAYLALTWIAVGAPLLYFWADRRPPAIAVHPTPGAPAPWYSLRALCSPARWNFWFLALAVFVLARFYAGLDEDAEGQIWVIFNFVDTAFHLSVANAFLEAPRFPPMDLDMAPFPLKYHFLADFYLAHLIQLGWAPLRAIWLMNFTSAAVMLGSLWAVFARWLKLPARWVMLAGFLFLFLNTSLVNLLHYFALKPSFFDPSQPFVGILRYPYFNFESSLANLFEPQRGLLFTMPVMLLILHLAFARDDDLPGAPHPPPAAPQRTLAAFLLVCLLPFSHIVGFAVLAFSLLPALRRHARWFFSRWRWWLPGFVLGALQLWYLLWYGPAGNTKFSAWDATASLPLNDFAPVPSALRRAVFWFFVNGDFFFWSTALGGVALFRWVQARRGVPIAGAARMADFFRQWWWYFAVCTGFFVLINFYRYSFSWGDSNKFVLFLNLGLSLVIVLGAAQWIDGRRRWLSHVLWTFLLVVAVLPPAYTFYRRIVVYPQANILFFHRHEVAAAAWLKAAAGPSDFILTAAYTDSHFVSSLAAQPTVAGIYADSNPYRQFGRGETVRRIYEDGALAPLQKLSVRYVCLSRTERRIYKLNPLWLALMKSGEGVVFHSGEPAEFESVFIFDAQALLRRARPAGPAVSGEP